MVIPPEVLLLYRIVLAILGFFLGGGIVVHLFCFFHLKLSVVLNGSVKNCVGILMGIALNLSITFENGHFYYIYSMHS